MRTFFSLILLLFSLPSQADLSFYGSLYSTSLSVNSTTGSSQYGGGIALTLFDLGFADIELGLEYVPRSLTPSDTLTYIQAPIGMRLFLGKIFTVSLGPYLSYHLSGGQALQPSSLEYGAFGKGGLHFPLSKMSGVILEAGYSMGLSSVGASSTDQYRGLFYQVGFRFME